MLLKKLLENEKESWDNNAFKREVICLCVKQKMEMDQLKRRIDVRDNYIDYLDSVQCGLKKGEECLKKK